MNRWTRKWLLAAGLGLGTLGVLYARCIEPQRVSLDRYIVPVEWSGLPPDGLTILHLSDLHWRAGGAVQTAKRARLQRLLAGEVYDLLVLTGDLIHDDAGLPAALAFIATLRPRLAAFSCPGNRDYWQSGFRALLAPSEDAGTSLSVRLPRVAARLADFARKARANQRWSLHVRPNDTEALHAGLIALGVQPLINASAHVTENVIDLWIAGVDDLNQGQPDLAAAFDDVPTGAPVILLAHNPDAWLDPPVARAGLVLAGHTHGGQFRVPLIGAFHTQGTYLSRRRPAGWFERGRSRMFVSRGLGESFPFRFGAPPQAVLIRLLPANELVV
jgi:predicted MPP superfamily phosphohydrolase